MFVSLGCASLPRDANLDLPANQPNRPASATSALTQSQSANAVRTSQDFSDASFGSPAGSSNLDMPEATPSANATIESDSAGQADGLVLAPESAPEFSPIRPRYVPVRPGLPTPTEPAQPAAPVPDPPTTSSGAPASEPAPGSPIQYVDYTGDDSNDGLSWGTAKKTIMAAYDALPTAGGTIYIMQGSGGDVTSVPATNTPGQGIWIMGYLDPNYSSPPPGWRLFKPNTSFIGVAATSAGHNSHVTGQVEVSGGGSSANQPCIWLSSVSGPVLFQNLKCGGGRGVVVGETSNNLRNGRGYVSGVTFDNVTTGGAPGFDITGGSFWLYFNDCVSSGSTNASVLDNAHAAMLIDGAGNAGNFLVFVTNLNTILGGIKFIPGVNGGSLTVDGMTEEGQTGTGPDIPPAIYVTYTNNFTTFHFSNITVADPGPSGADVIMIGGSGPAGAVLADGNLMGGPITGPATVMGEYPNAVANSPETPAQMGQVGFFNGYVEGQTDAARRNFSPTSVRFPNIAAQVPSQWTPQRDVSVTSGVLAPDGTTGAGRAVNASTGVENVYFALPNIPDAAVGDYFIGGVWLRSLASNGGYASSPTTDVFLSPGYLSLSGNTQGAVSEGLGQWSWQWFIYKVTSVSQSQQPFVGFGAIVGHGNPIEAYAPVLMHLPNGTVSDSEAYEIATNLSSYPDGLASGTVATLRGQQFAFGGTGNFFGILTQSNTANRTYTFPDASGTVALTNIAQSWSASQTLDSPILDDPTIDGQKLDNPPVATFSAFLPGPLSGSYTGATFTPDYGIVVTRVEVTVKTASQNCSSSAIISVNGTSNYDLPIPLATTDSGPLSIQMNAGTPVQLALSTPAQGCTVPPQDANIIIHYRMQ